MKNHVIIYFLFIGILLFVFSCEESGNDKNNNIVESELVILIPATNSTVGGVVNIVIDYTGENNLRKVEYYVNSTLLDSSTLPPFSYQWDTDSWTNGVYELTAIGYSENDKTIISNPVTVNIYNEISIDAEVVFDVSDFFPNYKGYKYSIGHKSNVCGETYYPYCYLIYSAKIKNVGGTPAYNVTVRMTVVVGNNINGSPSAGNSYFVGTINFGTVQPNESKSSYIDSQISCNYGPGTSGNNACFEDLDINDIVTQLTWN